MRAIWTRLTSSESRTTVSVVVTSLVGQVAQLVSGVASARLLGPTLRGQLAILNVIPGVASQVAHLGVPSAVVFYTAREPTRHSAITRSGIRATLAWAIAGGLLSAIVVTVAGAANGDAPVILAATIAIVPAYVIQFVALASLQGRQLFCRFNVQRILPLIFNALGLLSLLLLGISSVAIAFVILLLSQGIAMAITLLSASVTSSDGAATDVRALLRFGIKGLPATLSPIETFRIDQLVVGIALGTTALGYYAAATAFSALPRWVAQSVAAAAYPNVVSRRTKREMAGTAWIFILVTLAIVAAITAGLELVIADLTKVFFGRDFLPAVDIGRVLLVAAALMSCRRIVAECSRALGRPELDSYSEIACWPVLAAGLVALSPAFGAIGVAASIAAAYGVGAVVAVALLARAIKTGHIASPAVQTAA